MSEPKLPGWIRVLLPARQSVNARERLRVVAGALLGLTLTAMLSQWLAGPLSLHTWLLAPIGASAVLIFAAPASPLAQPWAIVAGNTVSAGVGVLCALWIPNPLFAAPVAGALAITLMFTLRCLHPPGGAMAVLAVLAHAGHTEFAVSLAAANSLILVLAGCAYNPATGRAYPHRQMAGPRPAGTQALQSPASDLEAILARYNQVLDISRDDLEALLIAAQQQAYGRRLGQLLCQDLMSAGPASVVFGTSLEEAWALLRERHIKALPVIDAARRVQGIVTLADILRSAPLDRHASFAARLLEFLRPSGLSHSERPEVVGQVMSAHVLLARQDQPAAELLPIFAQSGHHHLPVVDGQQRLVGMIAQSDFLRALSSSAPTALSPGAAFVASTVSPVGSTPP